MRILSSFFKILLSALIAFALFAAWIFAEKNQWIDTNLGSALIGKIGSSAEEESEIASNANSGKEAQAGTQSAQNRNSQRKASGTNVFGTPRDEGSRVDVDQETSLETVETKPSRTENKSSATPSEGKSGKPTTTKKPAGRFDYYVASKKPDAWPKQVTVTHPGSMIPLYDGYTKIGEQEIPVGTRVYVKSLALNGVLTVESQQPKRVFEIHASRTNFRKLYTGKSIVNNVQLTASSSSSSGTETSKNNTVSDDDFFEEELPAPTSTKPKKKSNVNVFGERAGSSDDDFFDDDF